jgi:drug/metabolite transporter superfamily protein YnfA
VAHCLHVARNALNEPNMMVVAQAAAANVVVANVVKTTLHTHVFGRQFAAERM